MIILRGLVTIATLLAKSIKKRHGQTMVTVREPKWDQLVLNHTR